MNISETVLEVIFNVIRKQNLRLLKEIAIREAIDMEGFIQEFKPSKKEFRDYIRTISLSKKND
jgi:hypothetical protein